MKKALTRFILLAGLTALLAFPWSGAEGANPIGLLTQKTVTRGTDAWLYVRTATDPNWLYVDRQGTSQSPATYAFGSVVQGTTYSTGLSYFTLQNYGEQAIDVSIGGTDMLGTLSTWTLSDSATAGVDTIGLLAGTADYNVTVRKTAPYNNLTSSLGAGSSTTWGLRLRTPTSMSQFEAMSGNITLTVSVS